MSDASASERQLDQFAALLRRVMADRGMMVKDLAAHLGVSRTAVSHWRSGNSEPTSTNVRRLAEVLDVPAARFYAALAGEDANVVDLPPRSDDRVPEWARLAGDLSAETVQAIRMLIAADRQRRQQP